MIANRASRYASADFRPYTLAIGQVALAWNDLQEELASLFCTLMSSRPQEGDMVNNTPLHVWNAINSDRSQREMLRAAIRFPPPEWYKTVNLRFDDLDWIVKEAEKIENIRNDAIHSPLQATKNTISSLFVTPTEAVRPSKWLYNKRAIKLDKRVNVLAELRYCRDASLTIAGFVHLVNRTMMHTPLPWPKRPKLPVRKVRKSPLLK